MDTSASSYTTVGDSFSSPPFSPTATSSSSSPPVGESSSSPPVKLDAIKENTSVLTEWPRRGQRQRRQGRQDIPTGDMSPLGSVEGGQQPQERRPGQFTLPPPVGLGSVDGGQQPQERRPGRLTPPPQVSLRSVDDWQQPKEKRPSLQANIRSSKTKERMAPSLDLPGEEKSSSDLSDSSETDDDLSYDTNHVLAWRDPGLPTPVFVRMHSSGVFYTYPTLGDKPFQSLDEVQDAVISYACPNSNAMSDEILSETERIVRARLFWPNGTRKVCTRAQAAKREHDKIRRLVEALLDKRNDTEGRVDELKNIVHWQSIFEGVHKWYYHLNITVKTKGAADDASSTSLFFVEVERDCNDIVGYYINTFFRVNTDSQDGEATCHGCTNNGSRDMKHPAAGLPAGSFKGGHMDIRFPDGFGPCNEKQWLDSSNTESEDEELIKEEEKRIRDSYEDPDDAEFWENARNKRLHYRSWDHKINLQSSETASECEDSFDYVASSSSWTRSSSKRDLSCRYR